MIGFRRGAFFFFGDAGFRALGGFGRLLFMGR